MLREAEAKRLRAAVQAAKVAGRYDLARANLQELAQRSRGTWPSVSQAPPVASSPRGPWWARWAGWRR
jgi:hypothetical protein